ncbi:exonuclease domain-containing protein [Amycolatopsis anabasis]|uniref:exonuclease domain-containing protein n=1 Tax=Amycolatopsis anabasis TaxID=1840409 RepID=UPI00131E1DF9|nr:exonuclease domain-containing protein [Amycolatopsis anabasis]
MPGYAVVDLETTGLDPGRHHRIVEVAVVHVSPGGEITGSWETLVNPARDLGPQRIHRVTAAQTLRAPTFGDIAGRLAGLLAGRVVVAHNLRFDGRFLAAEFARHNHPVPLGPDHGLCTMLLARDYLPGAGRSLADCCAAFGITIEDAHRASADALAAARLLAGYLRLDPDGERWTESLSAAGELPWPSIPFSETGWLPREHAAAREEHFLTRLVDSLPSGCASDPCLAYLALLDQALLDRHISVAEADALVASATELGIDRAAALELHTTYLHELVAAIDGEITATERADLHQVADLLGLDSGRVDEALRADRPRRALAVPRFTLAPGDRVAFTGETRRPRPEWERAAAEAGLVAHPAVTKKVKLLVAADPDTVSGKARKARDYGIPVIAEDAFAGLLNSVGRLAGTDRESVERR